MVDWHRFVPTDFEYDFTHDELADHRITFDEAMECFFSDFEARQNKSFRDRYQLLGRTVGGRRLKIIAGKCCPYHYRMGPMSTQATNINLSEKEIDQIVVAQANDDAAWEEPVRVHRAGPKSLVIPADLAARAAFLAKLHRKSSVDEWLTYIIEERVALEEAVYSGVKQELATKAK